MTTENTSLFARGELPRILFAAQRVHFIGICGVGMRTLARMLAERGYLVSGSDAHGGGEGALILGLAGIPVLLPEEGRKAAAEADLVVFSLAVAPDDPALLAARGHGVPCASRADLLAALTDGFGERVGVAGTHGKSTVTAMCGSLLGAVGASPTVAVGASLSPIEDGYRRGNGDVAVMEACEYRLSFLALRPTVAVLTNAEWDHPDCFPDHAAILDAFSAYLRLPSVHIAVLSADDAHIPPLTEGLSVPILSFGVSPLADVRATRLRLFDGGSRFTLLVKGEERGEVTLAVAGEHNVKNALAAFAVGEALGYSAPTDALAGFHGIGRRTERRGEYLGVTYYEDYGHHPTEIRAALAALRGEGRLICVFQPHTYSRTVAFLDEMAGALSLADCVIVTDVYAAREARPEGVSSRTLAAACGPHALYIASPEAAALAVRSRALRGDRVVVMGAGDIGERFFRPPLSFS